MQPLLIILIDVCVNRKAHKLYELFNIGILFCFVNLVLQIFLGAVTLLAIVKTNIYIIYWLIMFFGAIVFAALSVIIPLFLWLKTLLQFCYCDCTLKEELNILKNRFSIFVV